MGIISWIAGIMLAAMFIALPIFWIWAIYYKNKCRKVKDCVNRKCRYWEWCEHNQKARDKEFILLRIVMLEKRFGLDFSELKEKLRNDTKFEKQI